MKIPRSLFRYFLVLTLVCVLPLVLFAALLMHRVNDLQFRADSASMANASRNNAFRLDREIAEARALLRTLTMSNSLSLHDYERFRYAATQVAQRFSGAVTLIDPAGAVLVSTAGDAGDVPAASDDLIAAARAVTSSRETAVTTLFPIGGAPEAVLLMSAPAKDGRIPVIAFSVPLKSFAASLTAVPARLDTTVTLLDHDGVIVWRSDNADGLIGARDDDSILDQFRAPPGGMWRATDADHSAVYAAATMAKDTPWTVVVSTPSHAVDGLLDRALHQLSLALIGALAFAFIGAALLGRQLKRAIEDLIAAAKVLGEARRNPRAPMPVRELAELEAVLANASTLLTQEHARRNAAESAQEQSETLLTDLQHAASMASWEWDIATGSIVWSDAMYCLFLLAPEAMPPSRARLISLIHSHDRAAAAAWLATLARDEAHRPIEFHIMRADGETRSVRCDAKAMRDEHGVLLKILGTMQDVTELKHLEARLAESRGKESVAEEEPVDVAGLVGAAIYLAEPQAAQAGVTLAATVAPEAGSVKCSERDLKEILLRLMTRAITRSPQAAEVAIKAGLDTDGGLVIEIADHGASLAQNEIGEGGAFATVKSLIEKQGGSLRLNGMGGSGLVARIHLPAERVLRKVA
ncbi:MAG TPA: PAS domain-containing protein [Stellaceae bacterium]|jgi:PAS domain S-box-containing protein|nr:PAS domain-containing protein [Stellaceae bacterium]